MSVLETEPWKIGSNVLPRTYSLQPHDVPMRLSITRRPWQSEWRREIVTVCTRESLVSVTSKSEKPELTISFTLSKETCGSTYALGQLHGCVSQKTAISSADGEEPLYLSRKEAWFVCNRVTFWDVFLVKFLHLAGGAVSIVTKNVCDA
jgi:hypothetical protein